VIFLGPSYALVNYKASAQRAINCYLSPVESGNERVRYTLESVPGLLARVSVTSTIRGMHVAKGRLFVVAGVTLYEIDSAWTATARGTLDSAVLPVSIEHGLTQLVIADGQTIYVFNLNSGVFTRVTDPDVFGLTSVAFLDNFFIFASRGQQFQISAINDATVIDGLAFASAESAPDDLVQLAVVGSELYLFGETSIEVWFYSANPDFPFDRNRSAAIDYGLVAPGSVAVLDEGAFFVGTDGTGPASIYEMRGYRLRRISTLAVEEVMNASPNLQDARAYAYTRNGHKFYALQIPGGTTWVYDLLSQTWHERADLDEVGQYKAHRVTHAVSAWGLNIVAGGTKVYTLEDDVYTYDGDEIVRERSSPHDTEPFLDRKFFGELVLNCKTGDAALGVEPLIGLSWSNDGGSTWGNELFRSAGKTGERLARLVWRRLGQSRQRVWRIRCSSNAPFAIIEADAR
jgi:hypothetical protein